MRPIIAATLSLALLTACGGVRDDLTLTPEPLGHFRLAHNIVKANDPQMGPFSRTVSNEEWEAAVKDAIQARMGRYEGDAWYHIAVGVQGYIVAEPGIPLVYSPKSVLIFEVTFFEDATSTRLNPEPIQLTVFEPCCTIIFGSGLTRTREEQIEGLAFNAARAIERLARQNGEWFGDRNEVQAADPTIRDGNVFADDPAAVVPASSN